jgi:hypothetical protein
MITLTPQYIALDDVTQYLGNNVTILDSPGNGQLSTVAATNLVATAEGMVEQDLGSFYAVPFVTTTGQSWNNLSIATYTYLYKLFIARAIYEIYWTCFGIAGENKGDDYWTSALSDYRGKIERLFKKDSSGAYMYQTMSDLSLNPNGLLRGVQSAITGKLGGYNTNNSDYAIIQQTKPYRSFNGGGFRGGIL